MSYYEANFAAFRKRYPDKAELLQNDNTDLCSVVAAKNGMPTLKVKINDKEVFVHSAYDPGREALKWAEELNPEPSEVYVIFGMGLGYHIVELFGKLPRDAKLVVLEPNFAFVRSALEHTDLAEVIAHENVYLIVGQDIPLLRRNFMTLVDLYRLDRIKTVSYLPVTRTNSQAFEDYQRTLHDDLLHNYANLSTIMFFSALWTQNFFYNMGDIKASPGVSSLFGMLRGKPAILVSAGPSLTKNMHLLKEAKSKIFILCVGSALRVLLKEGIIPDIVVSIDGSEANYKHFQNLPEHKIPLVFDPILHHGIVEDHKGPKFVAYCNNLMFPWLDYFFGEEKGNLRIGASVANVSLDLLQKMEANPIIFVGQDLAFTEGVSHAAGTSHAAVKTIADIKSEKRTIEVEGINGGTVITDRSLYTFLKWFESYIAEHPSTEYINATEGGARIPGTGSATLRAVIDRYGAGECSFAEMLQKIHHDGQKDTPDQFDEIILKMEQVLEQIRNIKKPALEGFKKAQELQTLYKRRIPAQSEIIRVVRKMDKIDRQIKEQDKGKQMVLLLFQPLINALHQIFSSGEKNESEREKGQRIAQQSVLLYSGIFNISKMAEQYFVDGIERLKRKITHN